ncbi:protein BIG GRAIN 1-like A [Tasmannia lanceolata]|uniref:protein BIG GRAIN 1-like A n=1 Tax=Tasmannia lanceolata TaxID=3420 RepID=UPI004063986A
MDIWEKTLREERSRYERKNPSFSSTLLDAIYRSIDEGGGEEVEELFLYRETMRKKQSNCSRNVREEEQHRDMMNLHRDFKIEKKVTEKVLLRRQSASDFEEGFQKLQRDHTSMLFNSTSSSSDSSCGGFSSSEAESVYGSRSSVFTSQRPKPVRTGPPVRSEPRKPQLSEILVSNTLQKERNILSPQKKKTESFIKSKSRKIYGDLKKAKKQPNSPGGRLSSFLNSIFTAGNAKKAKISSSIGGQVDDFSLDRKPKSGQASTCSSVSSYSRSCLSKTPSSRGKSVNGVKRSVRFYPVSVIVDEDCRPCGQKCLYEEERNLTAGRKMGESPYLLGEELKFHLMEKNKRVEAATKDLLKGYQNKDFLEEMLRKNHEVYDEEDDDAASCSSSDLFELENLAAIGIERYREELPVYETTHLNTNRAIARGLIL